MKQITASIEVLSGEEIQLLHQATLEILESVGAHLPNQRILEKLEKSGAVVDYKTAQVRFPPDFIEMVMREIGGKKPGFGLELGLEGHPPHEVTSGPGNEANIVDYRATSRRAGTTADVIKGIVLCNELPYIHRAMPLVTPGDVPAYMGDLYGYYLCALYSRKPYSMYIMSPEAARRMIHIARLSKAGADPNIGYLLEPNGALSYDEISLEMALLFYEFRLWSLPRPNGDGRPGCTCHPGRDVINGECLQLDRQRGRLPVEPTRRVVRQRPYHGPAQQPVLFWFS